ncbi:hypothetical protein Hanom_Chr17g01543071 [Helianthus anomalus]
MPSLCAATTTVVAGRLVEQGVQLYKGEGDFKREKREMVSILSEYYKILTDI